MSSTAIARKKENMDSSRVVCKNTFQPGKENMIK
jgi:hypothetical protein